MSYKSLMTIGRYSLIGYRYNYKKILLSMEVLDKHWSYWFTGKYKLRHFDGSSTVWYEGCRRCDTGLECVLADFYHFIKSRDNDNRQ